MMPVTSKKTSVKVRVMMPEKLGQWTQNLLPLPINLTQTGFLTLTFALFPLFTFTLSL